MNLYKAPQTRKKTYPNHDDIRTSRNAATVINGTRKGGFTPVLLSFSGLPGVGKTTIAKALSLRFPSMYLRVDLVESALRESALKVDRCEDAGYLAIAAIARSNLQLGWHVNADTVNPIVKSRSLMGTDRIRS